MSQTALRSYRLLDLVGVAVVLSVALCGLSRVGDPGIGWHLRTGQWILEHSAIPFTDPFLTTTVGKTWIANQWLSDLLLWKVFSWGGFTALSILVLFTGILTFFFILPRIAARYSPSAVVLTIGTFIPLLSGSLQWFARPVIFSFLFFAVTLAAIYAERAQAPRAGLRRITVLLLFAIWANMHSAFPLGLSLLGIALIDSLLQRNGRVKFWLLALILCIAATLLNPYGFDLHRNIFQLLGSSYFQNLNTEWLSPNFHDDAFKPTLLLIALVVVLARFASKKDEFFELGTVLFFLITALIGRRYIPFFGIVSVPVLILWGQRWVNERFALLKTNPLGSILFSQQSQRMPFPALTAASLIVVAVFVSDETSTGFAAWRPVKAIETIANDSTKGEIFHSPDHGGYIIFRFYPERRAWIDDRNELNGEKIYNEYLETVRLAPGWQEVIEKYHFSFILLDLPSPLYSALQDSPKWERIYGADDQDDKHVVFRRR